MNFTRILAACDLSEPSFRAATWAQTLARQLQAELHIVHVHPEPLGGRGDAAVTGWLPPEQTERYMRFLREEVRRELGRGASGEPAGAKYHVLRGAPAEQILQCAREVGADLICVGATGKTAMDRI